MNFRRAFIVLAALVVFASFASAAIPVASTQTCVVTAASAPNIRVEGIAEQVGDVVLTCTGGPAPTATPVDIGFVNITVNYGVPVTSIAVGPFGVEAELTIDEPGTTGQPAISACALGAAAPATPTGIGTAAVLAPPCALGASTATGVIDATANNVYQGYITSSDAGTVEFDNVPVQALAANQQHVFRIQNIRVTQTGSPVVATVSFKSVTGSLVGLAATTATATVATPVAGLIPSVIATGNNLCGAPNLAGSTASPNYALLVFKEGFATAFKPSSGGAAAATNYAAAAANTSVTGSKKNAASVTITKYMTESGFTAGIAGAGAASSPTRVKAIFAGLDKNITYYVSYNNVDSYSVPGTAKATLLLQPSSTTLDLQTDTPAQTSEEVVGSTVIVNSAVPAVKLVVSSKGTATAVWQIDNPDPTATEALQFAVYTVFSAAAPPTAGATATVQLALAPTTAASGTGLTWIPRFTAPGAAVGLAPILKCQTSLLFPFVTNQSGFETGIAISNTSADPFGSTTSAGTCSVNFYGTGAPTTAVAIGPTDGVTAGTTAAATISGLGVLNFTGYAVATCNFQYAHGFVFVQGNAGASNSTAMGYLPLVLNNTNRGQATQGEALAQ